jgi:hypothetical protein
MEGNDSFATTIMSAQFQEAAPFDEYRVRQSQHNHSHDRLERKMDPLNDHQMIEDDAIFMPFKMAASETQEWRMTP